MRTTSGSPLRGGMKSITVTVPPCGLVLGLQDQRVLTIAPAGSADLAGRISAQWPCSRRAEQRRKARGGIEARHTEPVDRTVTGHERRGVAIADQRVVLDRPGNLARAGHRLRTVWRAGRRIRRRSGGRTCTATAVAVGDRLGE